MRPDFETWLPTFMALRNRCRLKLGQPVAGEITELHKESQELEPMLFEAQEHAADAVAFYYSAKLKAMEGLSIKGWPKSALDSVGKAASHRQLWAREHAERLVAVIISRSIKVAQALKLQTPSR